jgi:SAM-dependent methyltransferase
MSEHFSLEKNWPNYETAMTVFRYAIIGELCRGKRVLEIGAASGEGTALFAEVAKEVVAIDHQNIWEASPAAKMPNVRFVRQDALSMPAEWSGCFDVVIAMELIEHLDDYSSFQKSVFNVLSRNGLFVFSTPNFDIYSEKGDGSREPVYEHHRHEYCAKELECSFSDCWKSKKIMGLSQLSFPKITSESGDSEVLLYFENFIYQLKLGSNYPQYKIFKGESTSYSLPLEFCQSFLSILSKEVLPPIESILPVFQKSKTISISREEAAFCSSAVILHRRNEQYAGLKKHTENLENIIKDRDRRLLETKGVVADIERRLNETEGVVADRKRRLNETEGVVADRERQLRDRKKITESLERELSKTKEIMADLEKQLQETKEALADKDKLLDTIRQLQRRMPFRLAEKITGKKLILEKE